MNEPYDLDAAIRKVPDFPKPGILFYDVTGILLRPEAFRHCVDRIAAAYGPGSVDAVAAVEARGFVFAAPYACEAGLPLVLLRKKGKLPGETASKSFALEYGTDELFVHRRDVPRGGRILLVDDLIATGGTIRAAAELLLQCGAVSVDILAMIGLPFLGFREVLDGFRVTTLIDYHNE